MIAQKNPIARYRKAEATHVRELLASLQNDSRIDCDAEISTNSAALQGLQTPNSIEPGIQVRPNDFTAVDGSGNFNMQFPAATFSAFPMVPNGEFLMNWGLSSEDLNLVADQVMFDSPLDDLASCNASDSLR